MFYSSFYLEVAENDSNGTLKGVIGHTSSTKDLTARILAIFGTLESTAGASGAETGDSAIVPATVPSVDHGATSGRSSNLETGNQSLPTSIPATPNTSSTGLSDRENDQTLTGSLPEARIALRENHEPRADSETATRTSMKHSSQPASPPVKSTPQQDWSRKQREREKKQREERERIKGQIRHDHAERRRVDELRRQPAVDTTAQNARKPASLTFRCPSSSEIRVQIRTFEGSTLRSTFPKSATVASQIRPWIDSTAQQRTPYNLKIILTPRPNHTIEIAEEEKPLEDLDIIGSCTLVMAPVKGFVDSYGAPGPGLVGSAISGGYNFLSGSLGAVFHGVRSALGFDQTRVEHQTPSPTEEASSSTLTGQVRIRTMADQRIESQKDQQFYNGNQLNFVPRNDDADDEEKTI
jgi:UBX domain